MARNEAVWEGASFNKTIIKAYDALTATISADAAVRIQGQTILEANIQQQGFATAVAVAAARDGPDDQRILACSVIQHWTEANWTQASDQPLRPQIHVSRRLPFHAPATAL